MDKEDEIIVCKHCGSENIYGDHENITIDHLLPVVCYDCKKKSFIDMLQFGESIV